MYHFKAFDMMNLQYEIKIWKKMLNKAKNDKLQTASLPYTLWVKIVIALFVLFNAMA